MTDKEDCCGCCYGYKILKRKELLIYIIKDITSCINQQLLS